MINSPKSIINSLHDEPKSTYRGFTSSTALPTSLKFRRTNNKQAFTIVELLVVIVVIAILAAITIVSYTGITSRSIVASIQSDLDNNSKQIKLYYVEHGEYPTSMDPTSKCLEDSLGTEDSKYCLKASNGNTLEYFNYPSSDNKYLLIAQKDTTKYYITQNTSPNIGGRNLLYLMTNDNASFEGGGVGGWFAHNAYSSMSNSIDQAWHGTRSLKQNSLTSGFHAISDLYVTTITAAEQQVTFSARFYAGNHTKSCVIGLADSGGAVAQSSVKVGAASWQTLTVTGTWHTGSTLRFIQMTTLSPTGVEITYWDAIQLEAGGSATPF